MLAAQIPNGNQGHKFLNITPNINNTTQTRKTINGRFNFSIKKNNTSIEKRQGINQRGPLNSKKSL